MKQLLLLAVRICCNLWPGKKLKATSLRRILIIKLCCIGDILFTTPVLRALKANLPELRLGYMVTAWCRELVDADERVEEVIEFNAYERIGWVEKARRAWRVIRQIRRGRYDAVLVLHRSPLAGLLALAGGVPIRIGFDWQGEGAALTHRIPFRVDAHEIDRNLDCLGPLKIALQGIQPELIPPAVAQTEAEAFLKQRGHADYSGPLIAVFPAGGVNPGTTMTTKRWPLNGYRELCTQLVARYGASILLVGNREDAAAGDQLVTDAAWRQAVIRSEGKTSLLTLAALLQKCALFIGGDSGPLHIADAVGIPTVSMFGPTDPKLLAPRGERHRVLYKSMDCSPCYNPVSVRQSDVTVCRLGTLACMKEITAAEVLAAARELLEQKGIHES